MRSSVCEEVSSNSSSSSSSSTGSSGNATGGAVAAAAAGGSQWGGEAWDIFTSLAILVVEGRTPGGEKGFHAGPHCPTLSHQHQRHHCNTNNHGCVQTEWLLRQLRVMWGVGVGVALEVLVAPNCKHGAERVASLDTTTAPTNNLCLIERWNFVIYDRKVASAAAGGASLVAAVRSFLHFSQLSAWLSTSGGRHPPNVLYRLTVSSPVFCSKFTEEPEEHVFPVAFIGQDTSLKVSVRSLPRRDKVPIVVCSEQHHEQTRAETSVCTRPPQPPEIGMCEDDLRRSVMKARLGEVSVSRASRSQSPDTQLGESLLDPPNSLSRFPRRFQSPSRAGSPSLETPEHLICRPRHPQPSPSPQDLGLGSLGPSLRPFSWTQARYPTTSQQQTQLHQQLQQQQQQHLSESHLNVLGNISDSNLKKTDFSHVACSGGFQPQFSCASQEFVTQQRQQQQQQETFSFTPSTSNSNSQRGSYSQASCHHGTSEKYQYFPEYGSDAFHPSVSSQINLQINTAETKTTQSYSGYYESRKDQPTPISPLSPSFERLGDSTDFQSSPFDYSPDSSKLSSSFFENQCLHPPIFKNILEPESPKVYYNQQLFNKQKEPFNQYDETKTAEKNTRIDNEIGTKTKYPQVKKMDNSLQKNQKISTEIPESSKKEQKKQPSGEHQAEGQTALSQAVPISGTAVECSNGNAGRKNIIKPIPSVKSRSRSNWKQRSVCDESIGIVDDEMRPCCGQLGKHLCDSTEDLTEALKQEERQDKERISTRTKSAPGKSVSGSKQPTQSSAVQQELLRGKLNFSLTPRETLEILSVLRQPTPVPPLRISPLPGQCEDVNELSSSSGEARVSKMHTGPAKVECLHQQTTHTKAFSESGIRAELKDSGIKEWRDCEGKEWKQSGLKKCKNANHIQNKKEIRKVNNRKGDKECQGKEETSKLSSNSSSLPKSLGHNEEWCHSVCGDEKGVSETSCTRPKNSSLLCASVTTSVNNGSTHTSDGSKSCDIFSVKSLAATGRSSSGACISPELQPTAAKCDNIQSDNTSSSFSPNVKRSHMTKKQGKVCENRICQSGDGNVFESNKSFSSCLEVDQRSACVDAVKVTVKTNIYTANSEPAADAASCISSSECLSPRKLTTQTSVNSPFSAILSSIQNEDFTDKTDEYQNHTPYCLHEMHYQNKHKQHDREKVRRALKFDESKISNSGEQKTSIADDICNIRDGHKESKSSQFQESKYGASGCAQRESREGFTKGGSLLKHLMTTRTQTSQGSSSNISSNNTINNSNSQDPSPCEAHDSEHSDKNCETLHQNGHHYTCEGQLSNGVEHGIENGFSNDYIAKESNGFHSEEDQDEEVIKLFNGNIWRPIPTANDMAEFRRSLDSATNMVFHCKTGLPLTSSPAPQRRGKRFDYDSSLNTVAAIKRSTSFYCSALYNCEGSDGEGPEEHSGRRSIGTDAVQLKQKTTPLSTSAPATVTCSNLLGSFEECVLNGRLEPVSTVQGFTAEIAASGAFIPKHISKPVTVFFYTLCDNDQISSPYMGHINLGKKGYHVPNKGTVQVTLFNPHGTVVKMFVVMYDLSDMPPNCRTFVRQRTLNMPVGATDKDLNAHQWLRYLIHLRFASSKSGKVYLHTDIRMLIFRKSDADAATLHKTSTPYELRSFTNGPTNPKFSPRK